MRKKTSCLNQSEDEVMRRNILSRPTDCTLPRYSVKLFIIGCFCSIMLTACMWLPVAYDDFSVMGDDVFSNLIRNSSVRRSRSTNGVAKLDSLTMASLSRELFLSKKSTELIKIFTQTQGHCDPKLQMNILTCSTVRQWQFKIVGVFADSTIEWQKPTAKLLYHFTLSDSYVVTDLELKIIDLTNQTQ